MREVSGAINTMHSHFLAHCDLKSANILVEVDAMKSPTCYLTDFGITQVLSDVAVAAKSFDISMVKGVSIPYAAPEAISFFRKRHKGPPDFKLFDIFSLGCVFYEVTTRKQPWAV
jgi:serine/threonine-protein kinase